MRSHARPLAAALAATALALPATALADPLYGAIATSRATGAAGYTTRRATQAEASGAAKDYCKSPSCEVVVEFHDECAFLATGGPGKEGVGRAPRPRDAEQKALADCAAHGGKACKVVTWGCSIAGSAGQPPRDEWDLVEEDTTVPGEGGAVLAARVVRPPGPGPFPLVVVNHGSPRDESERPKMRPTAMATQARRFAASGYAAALVLRRGYGASTGGWAEAYGPCDRPDYVKAGLAGASDIASAVRALQKAPWVDARRVLVAGVSAGGFGSLAASSLALPGVVGVLNFAGGRGSQKADTVCAKDKLVEAARAFGKTARVPTLWVYAENDHYFAPALAAELHAAYTSAGGQATMVKAPAFADEGHYLFSRDDGVPVWTPIVASFLAAHHLPAVR